MTYPSIEYIRGHLRYDDGKLFWIERPRNEFQSDRSWASWNTRYSGKEAGAASTHKKPRCQVMFSGRIVYRYAIVWALHHGEWPGQIDHEDRDQLNDRIDNLRPCNHSQNSGNAGLRSDNTTGVKGVYWNKKARKFQAQISIENQVTYLGIFESIDDARSAYDMAASAHFGDFACTNQGGLSEGT